MLKFIMHTLVGVRPSIALCRYHCFDKDPAVAAWMTAHGLNSSQMIDYFWRELSSRVLPSLNRTVGVWMADTPNGASPMWPPPHMSTLPTGSVANVYVSFFYLSSACIFWTCRSQHYCIQITRFAKPCLDCQIYKSRIKDSEMLNYTRSPGHALMCTGTRA